MNVQADPLVDDYLRRLNAAASALPAHQREELVCEIRDHLREALRQTPAGDKAAVRTALERLGPPEEIAAAATDPPPPGQPAARPARRRQRDQRPGDRLGAAGGAVVRRDRG